MELIRIGEDLYNLDHLVRVESRMAHREQAPTSGPPVVVTLHFAGGEQVALDGTHSAEFVALLRERVPVVFEARRHGRPGGAD
jgi:hypothetical protein